MTDSAGLLLGALGHLVAAQAPLRGLSGGHPDDPVRDSALTEVIHELDHLTRRVRNIALLRGVTPDAVERVCRMGS